jgi:hypothetical protein
MTTPGHSLSIGGGSSGHSLANWPTESVGVLVI